MTTPIPISEREPVLPCELWHSELRCWIRATTAADYMPYPSNPATHWRPLPDSPKAPAVVPEQFKVKAHQFTGDKSLLHTGRLAPGERAYAGTPPAAPSPEAMKLASAIGCMSRNSERPWQNLFDDGSPLATDAARLIDAHTAAKDEEIAEANIECGRLKAREVTLTDRQVYVQMALKKFGFDFQAGEGLPELVERVASLASAYRARDNIGMSREEYHKAKRASAENDDLQAQLAAMTIELNETTALVDFAFDLTNKRPSEGWHKVLQKHLDGGRFPARPPASLVHFFLGLCASLQTAVCDYDAELKEARASRDRYREACEGMEKRMKWARKNCRIIYYPPDNAYPIEHAPHAGKDMWEALAVHADVQSEQAQHPTSDTLTPKTTDKASQMNDKGEARP